MMGKRLAEDHARARALSDGLNALGPALSATVPQTNIVQVDVSRTGRDGERWVADLEAANVRVRPWGRGRLRCVTHRHIEDADIARALDAVVCHLLAGRPHRAILEHRSEKCAAVSGKADAS